MSKSASTAASQYTRGEPTSEFASLRRVGLSMGAIGPFYPGKPIQIRTTLEARLPTSKLDVRVSALDSDELSPILGGRSSRTLAEWTGALNANSSSMINAEVTFAEPGYYRVSATSRAIPELGVPQMLGDSLVLDVAHETVWIRVSDDGGRVTAGYDSTAIDSGFVALYGSYGPFVKKSLRATAPSRASTNVAAGGGIDDIEITGYFRYDDLDLTPTAPAPVGGADVTAICVGRSSIFVEDYDLVTQVSLSTSETGYFSVNCVPPSGGIYDYIEGSIKLRNVDADVTGPYGAFAGANFWGTDGTHFELKAANTFAARVFTDLRLQVPIVFAKMGRTRGRIRAQVHQSDSSFGIWYCPSAGGSKCPIGDAIITNYRRVFSSAPMHDGLFVTVHEFGHGFHVYAVEPWGAYSCTPPQHVFNETENLSCAFVEGFADFLAMWTTGNRFITSPYGGDYGIENNVFLYPGGTQTNPPTGGDGMRVEAAVASFLYDLVDTGSELDSPTNSAGGAEAWDSLSVPASWLLDVIEHCRLDYFITQLTGPDELVYCLEGDATAYSASQAYSGAWRARSLVSMDEPLPTYSSAAIRTLWRYNFYGAYP